MKEVIDKERHDIETEDRLEFSYLLNQFIKSLFNYYKAMSNCIVLGIYGEWGSGKSTFLNFLFNKLEKGELSEAGKKIIKIDIDALNYKEEKTLWKPILIKIIEKLTEDKIIENKEKEIIIEKLEYSRKIIKFRFSPIVITFTAVLLLIVGIVNSSFNSDFIELPVIVTLLIFLANSLSITLNKNPIDSINMFQNELKEVKNKIQNVDATFFCVIDNLDRSKPTYIIDFLESLHSILNFPNFIYLLPCDPNILREEIKSLYKNEFLNAENYLNKIISFSFTIPPLDPSIMKTYIASLLSGQDEDFTSNLVFKAFNYAGITNPRVIKKILLETSIYHDFIEERKHITNINSLFILKLVIIKYQFPYIYQILCKFVEYREISENNPVLERLDEVVSDLLFRDTDSYQKVTIEIVKNLFNIIVSEKDVENGNVPNIVNTVKYQVIGAFRYFDNLAQEDFFMEDKDILSDYLLALSLKSKKSKKTHFKTLKEFRESHKEMKKIFIDFFEKNKFEIIYSNYADFIAKAKIQPDTDEGEERPEEYQYFLLKFAFIESDNLFNIKKSIRLLHENSSKFICSKKYERNNKINMCLVLNKYPLPKIKQFLESLERDDFLILWLEDGYFEGFEKSNNIIHGQPSIIIDEESMYEI